MMTIGTKGEHFLSLRTSNGPTPVRYRPTLTNGSAHIQASSQLP